MRHVHVRGTKATKASGASVAMDLVRKVLRRRIKPGSASLKLTSRQMWKYDKYNKRREKSG